MSWTSVPPQATFSTWTPRQIAKIGRLRARAAAISADLELVAPGSASTTVACARLAVARRRHIVAAGQHQAVDAGERLLDRHRRVENARLAADVQDRLPVVFELPAGRDANDRHSYIRFGTSMPIKSSARVNCART